MENLISEAGAHELMASSLFSAQLAAGRERAISSQVTAFQYCSFCISRLSLLVLILNNRNKSSTDCARFFCVARAIAAAAAVSYTRSLSERAQANGVTMKRMRMDIEFSAAARSAAP
jgi:hypothetical protein